MKSNQFRNRSGGESGFSKRGNFSGDRRGGDRRGSNFNGDKRRDDRGNNFNGDKRRDDRGGNFNNNRNGDRRDKFGGDRRDRDRDRDMDRKRKGDFTKEPAEKQFRPDKKASLQVQEGDSPLLKLLKEKGWLYVPETELHRISTVIRRAENTSDIVRFNDLLSEYAKDRKYACAVYAFREFVMSSEGRHAGMFKPSVYTFGSFINAAANCDDCDLAESVFRIMQGDEYKIPPNVIAFTALVKVFSNAGRLTKATELISEMVQMGIKPNIRTYNALLRGCMHYGAANHVKALNFRSHGLSPDLSTYEYSIKTLCHCGDFAEARRLCDEMDEAFSASSPAAHLSVAMVLLFLGKFSEANEEIARTTALLAKNSTLASGGADLGASVLKFSRHQKRELELELEALKKFFAEIPRGTSFHRVFTSSPRVLVAAPAGPRRVSKDDVRTLLASARGDRLMVELCSGYGDWIVDRAKRDPAATWCAVEIMHDRAYSAWSRAILNGVEQNVLSVCADAVDMLRFGLEEDSVDELFVNFPEPAPDGMKHFILTGPFVVNARKALKMGSYLTLVTDNKPLAEQAAKAFNEIAFFGTVHYGTDVPEDYGSSYFDRLWFNGKRTDRFIVRARKV